MATPPYKGNGQPQADDSFWSGLGGWIGGGTPAYNGDGQPSSASSGFLGRSAPVYKSAPSSNAGSIAQAIDASGIPPGPVVVLVPRGVAAAPCDAADAQDDQQQ